MTNLLVLIKVVAVVVGLTDARASAKRRRQAEFSEEDLYPKYAAVPSTSFSCETYGPGYYADVDTGCQVFHVCHDLISYSFLCPNSTIFNQQVLVCDWWYNVDCSRSPQYYELNRYLGDIDSRPPYQQLFSSPSRVGTQERLAPETRRRQGKRIRGFDNAAPTGNELLHNMELTIDLPGFDERSRSVQAPARIITERPDLTDTNDLIGQYAKIIQDQTPNYLSNDFASEAQHRQHSESIFGEGFPDQLRTTIDPIREAPEYVLTPINEPINYNFRDSSLSATPQPTEIADTSENVQQTKENYTPKQQKVEGILRIEPQSDFATDLDESPAIVGESINIALENAFAGDLALLVADEEINKRKTTQSVLADSFPRFGQVYTTQLPPPTIPPKTTNKYWKFNKLNSKKLSNNLKEVADELNNVSNKTQDDHSATESSNSRNNGYQSVSQSAEQAKQDRTVNAVKKKRKPFVVIRRPVRPSVTRPTRQPASTAPTLAERNKQNLHHLSKQPASADYNNNNNNNERPVSTTGRAVSAVQPTSTGSSLIGDTGRTTPEPPGFQSLNQLSRQQQQQQQRTRYDTAWNRQPAPAWRSTAGRDNSADTVHKLQRVDTDAQQNVERTDSAANSSSSSTTDSTGQQRSASPLSDNKAPVNKLSIEAAPFHEWLYFITGA